MGRQYLWTYACIAFWVELRSKTENIRFQRDTWEFTGAWFYFLRANAKCNLHLWWENTCWATGWPCVSIAALWLEVLHVQYVKLILLIYRLFSIWSNPATLPKMWNGPATTSGISGFLLCVFDWAQNSTKKIWSKSLKQTNADIKDAEIDLACCRSTIASLWRSRRALDQISKTIDWKKNEWNILQMKEFSQATKVNLTHGHNVAQQGLSHERCRLTLQVLARKNLKDAPVLRDFLFWFWDPSSPVRMYFVWYSCWNLAP